MARQCPNCGEKDLRDNAKFCDNCGFNLAALDEGATMAMPGAEMADDGGATMAMPGAEALLDDDEGSTRAMLDFDAPDDDGGATMAMLGAETLVDDDEGSTRAMLDSDLPDDEGSTRAMLDSDLPDDDDGSTRAMLDSDLPDDDEGSTRAMLGSDLPDDGGGGATTAISEAKTVEAASMKTQVGFRAGHVLHERYRLDQILGQGGFGAAYLAQDIKLSRRCVVKQMLARGGSAKAIEAYRASFEREAKLLADLNDPGHPNIPEIFDYFSDDDGNYLVMKFIEGQNLKDVLGQKEEGRLPWREAIRYAVDVCNALNYMHTQSREPVMHRDIKPANILLGDDGRVWLVDFGLATGDTDAASALQSSGSLGYAPLEQWLGQAVPASDVYAIGATLHHLVTGKSPLDAYEGQFNIVKVQELHGQFPSIRNIDRQLPKNLDEIISRAVAAEPEERLTALQLQQQLEVLISGATKAALYTFKNGKSARNVGELVDLCEQNRREAEAHLYSGDFERWFLLINRNDLAEAATRAVKQGKNQKDGLEKFLKLILPNLYVRRLRKFSLQMSRLTLQFALIAIAVVILLAILGSYGARWFIQQSLGSLDWNFSSLNLAEENRFTESFIDQKFNDAAGIYFDDNIQTDVNAPDQLDISASWNGVPLQLPVMLRLEEQRPHFYLSKINNIPLYLIGDNISQGINDGVDEAFDKGPVDLTSLDVENKAVVFNAALSGRAPFATPTPAPTPSPTPTVTPTPVNITLVVVFNRLNEDITLQVAGDTWDETVDVAANDTHVLETPPGTYNYTVRYKGRDEIVAQGEKTWTQNKAYRLGIGLAGDQQ